MSAVLQHLGVDALAARKPALRFLTAGSVDDGKSTLIGRLLHDSHAILSDQLQQLQARDSGRPVDLSLLTDGLEAEREQGITIDVAWRYFATPVRKFVIADAPGHEQYTRNMVTAAAGSDAAVVLVDITKLDLAAPQLDLLPQTRRHSLLAQLLRVPNIVFAVNKIDALADPGPAFARVERALREFATAAGIEVAAVIPVSALRGDNVALPMKSDWYHGSSLLHCLEQLPAVTECHDAPFSLPVQHVARPGGGTGSQPRGIWGRIAQGRLALGDTVQVSPSGERARVVGLRRAGVDVPGASAGQSAGLVLDRQLDISRGDWLAAPEMLHSVDGFAATLAWLDTEPALPGRTYWLRHGNRWVTARLTTIEHRLDIHDLQRVAVSSLQVNEIGRVQMQLHQPLPLAPYAQSRVGGSLIVVDPASHRTSGALLVQHTEAEINARDFS